MKALHFLSYMCIACLFTACDDGDDSFHYLSIPTKSVIYADQTTDTLNIISSDSWTASQSSNWLSMEYNKYDNKSAGGASKMVPLTLLPNTTDQVRGTYIKVTSNKKSLSRSKIQVYWMNIIRPRATYTGETHNPGNWTMSDNITDLKASFSLTDSASVDRDSILFYLYDKSATLQSNVDWITIENSEFTRPEGDAVRLKKAYYRLNRNTTNTNRTAVLTLKSSNGVSTPITITQLH